MERQIKISQIQVGDLISDGHDLLGTVKKITREALDDGNYFRVWFTNGDNVLGSPDGTTYRVS